MGNHGPLDRSRTDFQRDRGSDHSAESAFTWYAPLHRLLLKPNRLFSVELRFSTRRYHKRRHKQHPQRQIRPTHPPLHHQRHHRHTKRELLHHRRNHHRPQPHRVRSNNQKRNLPRQCATHKPVIKSRMRNRWRVLLPNQIKQKIQRHNHQHSPNPRHPKHHLRKFHHPSGSCYLLSNAHSPCIPPQHIRILFLLTMLHPCATLNLPCKNFSFLRRQTFFFS